jgi:hypothetical protein
MRLARIVCVLSLALAPFLGDPAPLSPARTTPKVTTVRAILKAGKRLDGARVEVRGTIMSGFETSVFKDDSTCEELRALSCSIWLSFDRSKCQGCMELIDRLQKPVPSKNGGSALTAMFVLDHVIMRGVVSTVRRDLKYARSVPRSARRGGFGHLGAYLAEIRAEELGIEQPH